MTKLDHKVVLITGCSGGLGRQMALRMAASGADLAICARNEEKLAATAGFARKRARRSWPCPWTSRTTAA